jgi:hypothetical protein
MATLDAVQKDFRAMVRELLGMPDNSVRKANNNPGSPAGKPNEQFATVLFTSIQSTGHDANLYHDNEDEEQTVTETGIGQRLVLISINFFKSDAFYLASRLKTLLTMGNAAVKLQAMGLGLVRVGDARDLSSIVDTKWEDRGQLDLEVHIIAKEEVIIPTFGTFPITVSTEEQSTTSEVYEP